MKKFKSFVITLGLVASWLTLNNAEPSYALVTGATKIEVGHVKKVENKTPKGKSPKRLLELSPFSPAKSRAYARSLLTPKQYKCVDAIWTPESHWGHKAWNRKPVKGKHAFGIPQILGMKEKNPYRQIDKGLAYIAYRYGTPCEALAFHKKHHYY